MWIMDREMNEHHLQDLYDVKTHAAGPQGRLPLETSRPGVFAVGDVRSGSVKRVAASVGDGAQVVAAIHAYLARLRQEPVAAPVRETV